VTAGTALLAVVLAAGGVRARPAVDLAAMHEAMSSPSQPALPSAASYAHFLQARLANLAGDHRAALDELRLALASDDGSAALMTALAEEYARLGELDRAEGQLQRVLELYPTLGDAHLLMGRVLLEARKLTRARAHLDRAIRLRPQDPDAYLVLTQLLLEQGRVAEAVKVVERLGAALPGDPVGFRRLGLLLAERGGWKDAESLLLRAVERDPGDLEVWVALARGYEAAARPPRALWAWEQAVVHDPENPELLLAAGRAALSDARPIDARAYFDQLLALGGDPELTAKVAFSYLAANQVDLAAAVLAKASLAGKEPRLSFYAGLVDERRGHWADAVHDFERVPPEAGELYDEARLHRASALSAGGQHQAALAALDRLAEERPELAGLAAARSRALERAGQLVEAQAVLEHALARSPSAEVVEALTGFQQRQGHPERAVELLARAHLAHPSDAALTFGLAVAQEKQGEWQRAVETMRALLVQDPTNAPAANFVGYTLADHEQQLDEALALVQRAVAQSPDSAAYLDSLGWVLFKRGEAERALPYLEQALAASPDEPTLLEHRAEVLLQLGRRADAQQAFSRALEQLVASPDSAERPGQRAELERKLKVLTGAARAR
jgi:tetratricopeptide (TPR) repeat protein